MAAGDMVPADVRVLSAKDLFLNQAALTGEALPVEKKAVPAAADIQNPLDLPNLCFLGSNVESGSATAVVIHTGDGTFFGSLASAHKEHIIRALQSKGHVLGFMGDGINDAPALKAADVGISVDSAVCVDGMDDPASTM